MLTKRRDSVSSRARLQGVASPRMGAFHAKAMAIEDLAERIVFLNVVSCPEGLAVLGARLGEGEDQVLPDLALEDAARERGVGVGIGEVAARPGGHAVRCRRRG